MPDKKSTFVMNEATRRAHQRTKKRAELLEGLLLLDIAVDEALERKHNLPNPDRAAGNVVWKGRNTAYDEAWREAHDDLEMAQEQRAAIIKRLRSLGGSVVQA